MFFLLCGVCSIFGGKVCLVVLGCVWWVGVENGVRRVAETLEENPAHNMCVGTNCFESF
jgi:hypothetical protein